jgi:hypothetical protein
MLYFVELERALRVCLAEIQNKMFMVYELEMPDIPQFTIAEEIPKHRDIGMFKRTCHVTPAHISWDVQQFEK